MHAHITLIVSAGCKQILFGLGSDTTSRIPSRYVYTLGAHTVIHKYFMSKDFMQY